MGRQIKARVPEQAQAFAGDVGRDRAVVADLGEVAHASQ